jgi:hypothetical protein
MENETMEKSAARAAFDKAIAEARLSDNPNKWNYAGDFMYMGREGGVDLFKHRDTRQYIGLFPIKWEVIK